MLEGLHTVAKSAEMRFAVARADDGDHGNLGEVAPALDVKQRRRRVDLGADSRARR